MEHFDENLILKKIRGTITSHEEAQVQEWLDESEENRKNYAQLKILWNAGKVEAYSSGPELNESISKINKSIDEINRTSRHIRMRKLLRYAAVFAGLVALATLSWIFIPASKENMLTRETSREGAIAVVHLSDGTKVWLNNDSKLIYPEVFSKKNRNVVLEGEAYFEVAKDPAHPFFVSTPVVTIRVLGTSFNINTRATGNRTQTVLVEGSVSLLRPSGEKIAALKPGQMATVKSATDNVEIISVDTKLYTAWQQGMIVFEKAELTEILKKIETVYHVRFSYDTVLMSKNKSRYNFVFRKDQDYDTVFNMLRFVAPLDKLKVRLVKLDKQKRQ